MGNSVQMKEIYIHDSSITSPLKKPFSWTHHGLTMDSLWTQFEFNLTITKYTLKPS